ncbi:unnamed protein product, partial [Gadus morhua 'NCC']
AAFGPRGAGEKRLGARGAHECQARGRAGGKGGPGLGAKLLTVVIDRRYRSLRSATTRLQYSFFPQAIRLLNSKGQI